MDEKLKELALKALKASNLSDEWLSFIVVDKEEQIPSKVAAILKNVKGDATKLLTNEDYERIYTQEQELRKLVDTRVGKGIETYKENHPALTDEQKALLKKHEDEKALKTEKTMTETSPEILALIKKQQEQIDKLTQTIEGSQQEQAAKKRAELVKTLHEKYKVPELFRTRYKEPADADDAAIEADIKALSDGLVTQGLLKIEKVPGEGGDGGTSTEAHKDMAEMRNKGGLAAAGSVPAKEL